MARGGLRWLSGSARCCTGAEAPTLRAALSQALQGKLTDTKVGWTCSVDWPTVPGILTVKARQ